MARPKLDLEIRERRETLGRRVKIERATSGLSQSELATLLGVAKIDVQRFESGAKAIPLDLLPRLCECLGVTASRILDDYRGLITRAA